MVLLETYLWYFMSITISDRTLLQILTFSTSRANLTSDPSSTKGKTMQQLPSYITLSDEVQSALQEQRPVVALESTVIAHGLPYPANVEVAQAMESTIRTAGAIPATVGIHNGAIKI